MMMTANEKEAWLAIRKAEAEFIDPKTAEVTWSYQYTLDPYGLDPEPPEESAVGREYFARRPGSDIWVLFDYLSQATVDALWARHKPTLMFPAGLEGIEEIESSPPF
jgi:hypothetical protein